MDRHRVHLRRRVRRALGHLDAAKFADDERFATTIARLRNRTAVNDLVAERTRHYEAEELARKLQASGVAAAALAHQQEMHTDEHLAARNFFTPDHPSGRWHARVPRAAGQAAAHCRWPAVPAAPTLGQHNEYVYKEVIGLSDEEYQKLVDDQVIGTAYLETAHA